MKWKAIISTSIFSLISPGLPSAGGLSFYVQNKKLHFTYNLGDGTTYTATSKNPVSKGNVKLSVDVSYNESQKQGRIILYIDGVKDTEKPFGRSIVGIYSHEGVNVGLDDLSPVADTYKVPFAFTGTIWKINWIMKPRSSQV